MDPRGRHGDLGTLGGTSSIAWGVNADGSVVVGEPDDGSDIHAFRWTRAGDMEDIGTLGGDTSHAYGVSADGSVVVGQADDRNNNPRAFRWTRANGMEDLGDLGEDESAANGVSADGSVVVGWADDKNDHDRAFRWTRADGMEDLGDLGGDKSEAEGVSADGSVVVGYAYNKDGHSRAFRWTRAGGMEDIGTLGGDTSHAYGVNADGSVVVGSAKNAGGHSRAFIWSKNVIQDYDNLRSSVGRLAANRRRALGQAIDSATDVAERRCDRFSADKRLRPGHPWRRPWRLFRPRPRRVRGLSLGAAVTDRLGVGLNLRRVGGRHRIERRADENRLRPVPVGDGGSTPRPEPAAGSLSVGGGWRRDAYVRARISPMSNGRGRGRIYGPASRAARSDTAWPRGTGV